MADVATAGVPLSPGQEGIWFADQMDPGSPAYNVAVAVELIGPLDIARLQRALDALVRRHDALRTMVQATSGEPRQIVTERAGPLLDVDDTPRAEVAERIAAGAAEPFDLGRDSLLRARLNRVSADEHVLCLCVHHIVCDGQSLAIALRDLAVLYRREPSAADDHLPRLTWCHRDYAQRQHRRADRLDEQVEYWTRRLADVAVDATWPPRPARSGEARSSSTLRLELDATLVSQLEELGRQRRATLFMTLASVFATVLYRYSATTDLIVGVPVGDRAEPDLADVVGMFVNLLPLRVQAHGDLTFAELLSEVRKSTLDALRHRDLPFERITRTLRRDADGRSPLARVVFGSHPVLDVLDFGAVQGRAELLETGAAKFDVNLSFARHGQGVTLRLEYTRHVVDQAGAERLLDHVVRVAREAVASPGLNLSRFALLTAEQNRQVGQVWSQPPDGVTEPAIHTVFEQQVGRRPDAIACVDELGGSVTYAELNRRANRLAARLLAAGVRLEDRVGIHAYRGVELVIAVLGVLKVGGVYVPLDPGYPRERLRLMARNCAMRLILRGTDVDPADVGPAEIELGEWLRGPGDAADPAVAVRPDHGAYVMYTSGSTGQPKGVLVLHQGVVSLVRDQTYADWGPEQRFLLLSSPSFDGSTFELFGALLTGGVLVIYSDRELVLERLERLIRDQRVTTLWLTTTLFHYIVDDRPEILRGVAHVLTGGEALSPHHAARAQAVIGAGRLTNGYGPTECTTFTTCHAVDPVAADAASVPIGRPIKGRTGFVLGRDMELLPPGIPGELYAGGPGVARGYLNQPSLTAERFVPDPFGPPGQRLYRTGDRVRWLSDGTLEFLGRFDDQIKIRGHRVEPGEAAARLRHHPGVEQVAVIASDGPAGDKRLIAYVVPRDSTVTGADLRRYATQTLPPFLVPSAVILLGQLPLNLNGKLDRGALPVPESTSDSSTATGSAEERSYSWEVLAGLFAEVLGRPGIGPHDDFFDEGGHSLLAMRLRNRVRATFNVDLPMRTLFEAPTIAQLADRLGKDADRNALDVLLPLRPNGDGARLFCVHPGNGIGWAYSGLLRSLPREHPVFAIQARALSHNTYPTTVTGMAEDYLAELRTIQPSGPYHLLGWCFGGVVAHEMAALLEASGEQVELLAILDAFPSHSLGVAREVLEPAALAMLLTDLGCVVDPAEQQTLTRQRYAEILDASVGAVTMLDAAQRARLADCFVQHLRLSRTFQPGQVRADLVLIVAGRDRSDPEWAVRSWQPHAAGAIEAHTIDCHHTGMMSPSAVAEIGRILSSRLGSSR